MQPEEPLRIQNVRRNKDTYSLDDPVDHFNTSSNFLFSLSKNKAMKVFLSIISELVRAILSFLDTTLPSNTDLRTTFSLHLFQAVATRSNKQSKEVDFRKLFHRNVDFIRGALGTFLLVVFNRWSEIGIIFHSFVNESDAFVFEFLAVSNFACVCSATVTIIGWWGRRGSEKKIGKRQKSDDCDYTPLAFWWDKIIQS
jgi:hypothetical protein